MIQKTLLILKIKLHCIPKHLFLLLLKSQIKNKISRVKNKINRIRNRINKLKANKHEIHQI